MNANELKKMSNEVNGIYSKNAISLSEILSKCVDEAKLGNYSYSFKSTIMPHKGGVDEEGRHIEKIVNTLKDYGYDVIEQFQAKHNAHGEINVNIKVSWE